MARASINGVGVAVIGTGALLAWTGITGTPVVDGLRNIARGLPAGTLVPSPSGGTPGSATGSPSSGGATPATGARPGILAAARKYLGVPYRWGGTDPRTGLDCSGLVIVALRDAGFTVSGRPTASMFYFGRGIRSYPVTRAQVAPGDLVCWPTHIGIAVSGKRMVHAPRTGRTVSESNIWGNPVFRRVGAAPAAPSGSGKAKVK